MRKLFIAIAAVGSLIFAGVLIVAPGAYKTTHAAPHAGSDIDTFSLSHAARGLSDQSFPSH